MVSSNTPNTTHTREEHNNNNNILEQPPRVELRPQLGPSRQISAADLNEERAASGRDVSPSRKRRTGPHTSARIQKLQRQYTPPQLLNPAEYALNHQFIPPSSSCDGDIGQEVRDIDPGSNRPRGKATHNLRQVLRVANDDYEAAKDDHYRRGYLVNRQSGCQGKHVWMALSLVAVGTVIGVASYHYKK